MKTHFLMNLRRQWSAADLLVVAMGLFTLAEHLRARSAYAIAPFFALILPTCLILAIPDYRRRMGRGLRSLWLATEAFSTGSRQIPWMAAAIFIVLPSWLLYLSNQKTLGATDTRPVIPTAVSLLTQGDSELGEYFAPGAKLSLRDKGGEIRLCFRLGAGGIYSAYPAGMVPFAATVTGFAAVAHADLLDRQVQRRLEKMTAAIVAAVAVGLFFLTALRLATPRVALVAAAILAAGSGMFSTVGMALWQHGGIIVWSSLVMLVEFRDAGRPTRRGTILQGVACALMATCRLTSASFLIPFGVWVLIRDPRRALAIVGVAALAFAPWGWFHATTYGNPFGPSTAFLSGRMWTPEVLGPLAGVLMSPARGLFVYQPWIALAPLAWLAATRSAPSARPAPAGWISFCLSAIAIHVVLIAVWGCWWGGWCWGSRLLVDIVPLCGLLCVRPIASLWETRWGQVAVVSLGLLGVMAQVPVVYGDASRWNATARVPDDLWSWSRTPILEPFREVRAADGASIGVSPVGRVGYPGPRMGIGHGHGTRR